jgi:hypothetical protein
MVFGIQNKENVKLSKITLEKLGVACNKFTQPGLQQGVWGCFILGL